MTTRRLSFLLWFGALAFIVAAHLSLWLVLEPTYRQLERQQTTGNLIRANELLNQKLRSLESNTQDYAFWDDSYTYVQHPTRAFEEANLVPGALKNLGISLVAYTSLKGKILFEGYSGGTEDKFTALPAGFAAHLKQGSPLFLDKTKGTSGFLNVGGTPWLVAVKPVLKTDYTGPAKGFLIMARPLDEGLLGEISQVMGLKLHLEPGEYADHTSEVEPLDSTRVSGHYHLYDVYGQPVTTLSLVQGREVYLQGRRSLIYAAVALVILALIGTSFLQTLINRQARMQRERLELEQRYRAVVEQASEGMAMVDTQHLRILEANASLGWILGLGDADFSQTPLPELLAVPAPEVAEWVRQVREQGQASLGERRYRQPGGQELEIEISGSQINHGKREFMLMVLRDATSRRKQQAQIERMVYQDALTGLANRRFLQERTSQTLAVAQRMGWPVAFLYLDLDRFKGVNDTLGHDFGDMLLTQVAQRLTQCVRQGDTLARLGGDEFGVLLYQATREQAQAIAAHILESLHQPFLLGSHRIQIGASIGVACYPEHSGNLVELLKSADIAMYEAKRAGSGMTFFDPKRNPYPRERLELESSFRQALEASQVQLHYQPVLNLRNGQVEDCEGLARWHSKGSWVPPWSFILMAEESGLIFDLDRYVIERALEQWQQARSGGWPLQLSLNLSAASLSYRSLAQIVEALLQKTQLPPGMLNLEITETALVQHPEVAQRVLADLRALGVRLILDDFGSGYASVAYLRQLAVDRLKLDRSLTANLGKHSQDEKLALACIALGHSLDLEVIAEGIETPEQLEWLKAHDCDYAQGYLIGKPMPLETFRGWLSGYGPVLPPEGLPTSSLV